MSDLQRTPTATFREEGGMTGVEPVVLAGAKAFAPYAARAAARLSNALTYRFQIERRIHAEVRTPYPRRALLRWLKALTPTQLMEPFDVAGPRLALELNDALRRSATWRERTDGLSVSLQIVEAMYRAVLRTVDDSTARALAEQWAAQRNSDVVDNLVSLVRATERWDISDADLGTWLERRAAARQRERLAPFGLDTPDVAHILTIAADSIPEVTPGSCVILVGTFGTGKTEIAEAWHQASIRKFKSGGPLPIWLRARDVVAGGGIDIAIGATTRPAHQALRGVAIVVDGLDEIDGTAAKAVVADCQIFTAGRPDSQILITARPGTVPGSRADVSVAGLSEEVAQNIVATLSGQTNPTLGWTTNLTAAIRTPFFAIAAGVSLARGDTPRSEAALIRVLVEQALEARAQSTLTSQSTHDLLTRLAVELTRSNGDQDGLSFAERAQANVTRLTISEKDGTIRFNLPIFQQWFAAQALLKSEALVAEALADPRSFDRWRWTICVALVDASTIQTDRIIGGCLKLNPGAAGWVVDRVAQGWSTRISSDFGSNVDAVPQRLLNAARGWIDAIGALAPEILPVSTSDAPLRLGVSTAGSQLSFAWSTADVNCDEVVALPNEVSPLRLGTDEWVGESWGPPPTGPAWPWEFIRDTVSRGVLPLLNSRAPLGPLDGIWRYEARYSVARAILNRRSVQHESIERDLLLARAKELEMLAKENPGVETFRIGSKSVSVKDIRDLSEWLEVQRFESFGRLIPAADIDISTNGVGGWVWDLWSPTQLRKLVSDSYGLAVQAYEELVAEQFASFSWSLGRAASGPFAVVAVLSLGRAGYGPVVDYYETTMPRFNEITRLDSRYLVASNGRAAVRFAESTEDGREVLVWPGRRDEILAWAREAGIDSPFWSLARGSAVVEVAHDRPASLLAAHWLHSELKRLGMAGGTFPQL